MNATDLMLGDYILVKTDDNTFITDFVCDIGYVSQWNELGVKTCKCSEWLRESEISPIPLTEDILKHSGFPFNKKETESSIQQVFKHYTKFFDFPLGQGFYIEHDIEDNVFWISDHCWFTFKYVHEFQHILKLCRINNEVFIPLTEK